MSDIAKSKKRQSANNSAYYKLQFGRTDDNKKKRLVRHLRKFPEDVQAAKIVNEKWPSLKTKIAPFARAVRRQQRAIREAA